MIMRWYLHMLILGKLVKGLICRDAIAIGNCIISCRDMGMHMIGNCVSQVACVVSKAQPTHWSVDAGMPIIQCGIVLKFIIEVEKLREIVISHPSHHGLVLHFASPNDIMFALLLSHSRRGGR